MTIFIAFFLGVGVGWVIRWAYNVYLDWLERVYLDDTGELVSDE